MAPGNSSTAPMIHDELDIAPLDKPFKSTTWKPAPRRNKNLKQVLTEVNRAQAASLMASQANTGAPNTGSNTPIPDSTLAGLSARASAAQQASALAKLSLASSQPAPTYGNIDAAPSLQPQGHWCDLTGLPAAYTDPKTKLRYANKEVYGVIRNMGQGVPDQYLAVRGANVVLK
ncbi:chromatin-remodeling complex subunit ies6 [Orbilia brochopaga]|uniref:Chromatin-remodeling complex subunit ies6 n=1 Tax=Orbilia brochopaga TaxID=3140254 RepID=A0AAV9UGX2_9PEZI